MDKDHYDFRIFAGDINIDLLKNNGNITTLYLNTLGEFGYLSIINNPTRVMSSTKSCFDQIFKLKIDNFDSTLPLNLNIKKVFATSRKKIPYS